MKIRRFVTTLIFGLILTFAGAGCKHKPPAVTPLDKRGLAGEGPGPGPGGTVGGPGSGESATSGGIPQGPGHQGWIEHPEAFKSDTVYFEFDSSSVKPAEKSKVAAVADQLKSSTSDAVRVEGHCDERGTEEYNRSLGERRALALREELVTLGIDPTRVDTISYGKDRPAETGHDESAWKKNRRGEFILLTPPK
jgi:peptidoglycan-associated lipoprotein